MSGNVNRNGNLNNSRIFLPSPQRYLSQSEFQEYLNLIKEIANFDPGSKKWYVNEFKIKRFDEEELREIIDQLSEYLGHEIYNLFSNYLIDENETIKAQIRGNYIYVYDDINKYKNLLAYRIKTFDHRSGQYVDQEVLLAWQKDNYFVTLRGLYWKLQLISKFNLQPFANLQFYDIQLKSFETRKYQVDAIRNWLNDANLVGAGLVKAPTGSGKSVIAILSTLEMLKNKPNAKVIYTVTSTTLLKQFKEFAKKEDLDFLIVSGELDELAKGEKSDLIAMSIQYYYSRKKRNQHEKLKELISNADLVITDEAHHTPAQMVKSLLQDAPNSLRLGLTATPLREDGRELEMAGFLGRITYTIEYLDLVKNGYLSPITYIQFIPKIPPKLAIKIRTLEQSKEEMYFSQFYSALLKLFEKSPLTNKQIVNKIKELGQYPALIIVRRIAIAKILTDLIQKEGINADYVTSKTKLEDRMKKIENLKNGQLQILVSTSLADEGLDIPNLRLIVLLSQGKSRIKLIQRIGRVMRPYKGKTRGYVLDVSYNHEIFLRQASRRLKFIQSEYNGIIQIGN